ncbi:MAG TPA: hypothetical protein VEO54_20880 [Thermoanaerobaculia bacterium]|nr:hypothetical protein [Thermoanaerobaculia bacterium]
MTVSAQSRRGMTWTVLDQQGGYVHVGADGWTNAYQGDTSADQYLPLLCVQVDWQPAPSWISFDFYNGWVRGTLQATGPVQGYALTSRQRADEICAQNFGWGYRMAEFHDGYYGPNFEYSGGWTYWGAGSLPWGTRFWTAINDQPANPWNSGGGTPQSAAEILRGIDANALRQVALWGSDQELASYLTPIANQVADYALHKYGEDIRADIADHPESAVVLAFFYYGIEHGITAEDIENDCPSSTMAARLASPVECFAEALDDILGTDDIKNLYRDFTRGVSARTVIGAVKTMARRVAWGITIGIAVVKLAICMDWV